LIAKLIVALYLLASALAGYDRNALSGVEIALRLIVALLIMFKPSAIHLPALLAAGALLASHYLKNRQIASAN